ncbi:LysE family translocator [Parageobacillus toebii NBRC 107807]|uniref:Threonine/homoserine/homoserine lactone efflux protein n=1 Tax=Parageobacillus toebii NBRC 107807 TaxID=1223503 RepID=A0A6G9J6L5_9BACL|nr:LysE family translocator [Parageobacillus toebii]MBB3869319.1 threonine/homoserine/homoserine lactone efflux protein [Parageobacillus toebii NBRC 107807]QIQ33580.1 LysE family translocator [Parageobacillus toebii NBRC 107807]
MDFGLVMSFLGVAILLTLMPGPDILFVITQSISQDKKAGVATALGLCSGLIVHITAAALGISAIIYQSALAFTVVKYMGAAYLLYLAWQSFKEKETGFTINHHKPLKYKSLYKKGIFMNLLNPKVSLFFLALLPQFVNKSMGHIALQMLILGIIFLVQALVIFVAVSVFSEKLRHVLLANSFIAKRMNIIKGLLLGLIGTQMALSEK